MRFDAPLEEGILLKRYKRFLADVQLPQNREPIVAHVANPGSMLGVSDPGSPCRLSLSKNLNRKLPYSLEMVKTREGHWVGINTSTANKLVQEAFTLKTIPAWREFTMIKSEVKINKESRLDFLLTAGEVRRYVEVKNVSMAQATTSNAPRALFPDAVTERGQKHLRELAALAAQGFQAELLFVVQREDCETFRPCDEIDPEYGKILRQVIKQGVIVSCWACAMTNESITLSRPLELDF